MRFIFRWWRYIDPEGLARAKQADADADRSLSEAKASSRWAARTLDVNNLTERFYRDLRHGGKA